MTRLRKPPRRVRVTRNQHEQYELAIAASSFEPRVSTVLNDIEAHMLYVKLAIALGFTDVVAESNNPQQEKEE